MFRNRKRAPFDWENEELAETLPEPEEPIYPEVLAEVPGLVLESDLPDVDDAVTAPPTPTDAEQAAAALENAGITPDSDVIRGITGVHRDAQEWIVTYFLLSHLDMKERYVGIKG